MKIVWLKGDYTGRKKERQQQAREAGCDIVIDFHFNASSNPDASGGQVWYRVNHPVARAVANEMARALSRIHPPVRTIPASTGARASFINSYPCAAVLLEPLFISNRQEAAWIHDIGNLRALGESIASEIAKYNGAVIGLSIGHKFKSSAPDDRGALCILGDTEADHAERLAKVVAAALM